MYVYLYMLAYGWSCNLYDKLSWLGKWPSLVMSALDCETIAHKHSSLWLWDLHSKVWISSCGWLDVVTLLHNWIYCLHKVSSFNSKKVWIISKSVYRTLPSWMGTNVPWGFYLNILKFYQNPKSKRLREKARFENCMNLDRSR